MPLAAFLEVKVLNVSVGPEYTFVLLYIMPCKMRVFSLVSNCGVYCYFTLPVQLPFRGKFLKLEILHVRIH